MTIGVGLLYVSLDPMQSVARELGELPRRRRPLPPTAWERETLPAGSRPTVESPAGDSWCPTHRPGTYKLRQASRSSPEMASSDSKHFFQSWNLTG